jgi:autotransporter-associated beta strand protein
MRPTSNPFLRTLAVTTAVALGSLAHADLFDTNGTTALFGVTDGSTYDWLAAGQWNSATDATGDGGTAATATWTSGRSAYLVGAGSNSTYTIRLGATGASNTNILNLAINVNAAATGALSGAVGNVTIGNSGDTGILTLSNSNSVGAQGGGTLTINNGVNLATRTLNFRGGNVVINGLVSGTGTSKIAFGNLWGLTAGTLTLANTANTYAGRANTDYINSNYTLAVTKLANGGSNSSIGTSSANIGINGGTLRYIGNTGAQSTNLGLHIGSSGAFVDASGTTSTDTISIAGTPTYSAADSARTITLTGANLGDNTMGFAFNNNGTGANILTKTGVGRWVVNQANGYTGGTNANGGTLVAANTAAFGTAGRTINFSTGTVEFATDTTANAYVLNLGSGNTGAVVVNRATSASTMTHSMGTATIGNSTLSVQKGANVTGDGTLEFAGISLTAGVPGLGTVTLNPTTAKISVLSGGITRTGNNASSLTLDGTIAGNTIAGVIANRVSDGAALSLTKSNLSTWELSVANTFSGKTLVTGGTLKLTHNQAIQNSAFDTSGAGTLDITTINTPTFGGLTSATNYELPSNVTSLTLNPNSGSQTFTGNLGGGASGLTLTKTGAGTQILGGTNSYSGLTTVNGGELRITTAAAIGSNNVTVTSGQLALDGGITVSGKSLTTSGAGSNFFGGLQSVSGTNEWAGSVLLGADLSRMGARRNATLLLSGVIDDGASTHTLIIRNENQNNTSGGGNATTITELSGVSTYGGNTQLIAGVTRLAGGDNRLPVGTVLQFGGSGANAKFDMNGRNQEVAGLAVMSNTNDTQRDWNANELTNSSGTLSNLTVNTTTNQTFGRTTSSFGGSTNYTGIITGNIALAKSGSSALTLTGANTYTGATTVNNGSLTLGIGGSISASTTIDIKGSATLDVSALAGWALAGGQTLTGTGTVEAGGTGNAVTISSGAFLAPGASPGTLMVNGDLAFASGSTFSGEIQTSGSPTGDLVNVNGDLDIISGALLDLGLFSTDTALSNGNKFSLFSYSGAWNLGTFSGYADDSDFILGLNEFRINYNDTVAGVNGGSYSNFVTLTVVPEPSAALLGGLGLLALLRRRRA